MFILKKILKFKLLQYKKLFFFIFLILFVGGFLFVFKKDFNSSPPSFEGFVEKEIKSSCRIVPHKAVSKLKLTRAQKLNRLMDVPIDWTFKSIQGEVIDLYCLRGKKKLVLNFWATWCPPCIKELSSLARLAKENKTAVFVAAISSEDKNTVQNFLDRFFSDLDSALVVAVVSEEEKLKYFPKDSLPATYIFDTKALLKIKELGDRDWSNKPIRQSILSLD